MTATTARKSAAKKAGPKPAAGSKAASLDQGDELAQYAVQLIAIDDIDVSVNPRRDIDPEAVAEMADSITEVGLLTPIKVEDTGGTPPYRLVFGGRRLAAFQKLGRRFIPAYVQPAGGDAGRTAAARLVENLQRVDLSPIDEADALQALVTEHGLKQADVAKLIGRNQGHVSKRLALRKLTGKGQNLVTSGLLPLEQAVEIAKLPAAIQTGVYTAIQGGTTPEVAVRNAREKVKQLKERTDLIARLRKAGTPVIDRAEDSGRLPDDAARFHGASADWEADEGRLAVVQSHPSTWSSGDERWLVRYTTTEQPATSVPDAEVSLHDASGHGKQAATGGAPDGGDQRTSAFEAADADRVARQQAAREAELAQTARLAELREFVRTLVTGKVSPTWERFLVRLHLVLAIAGDPDEHEGCPAAVSSAGEALQLQEHGLDLAGYETMNAALDLLAGDQAYTDKLLRLALATRLLNGLRFIRGYQDSRVFAGEVLAFLQAQGLELTEAEQTLADTRSQLLEGMCVEYDLVQGRPDDEPGETEDDIAARAEAEHPVVEAELPEVDEATGEPDRDDDTDFDAPVETFRPDRAAEAAKPTKAEIEALTRPNLIKLAEQHKVETTPRMTRLQLVALLTRALVDPADAIA